MKNKFIGPLLILFYFLYLMFRLDPSSHSHSLSSNNKYGQDLFLFSLITILQAQLHQLNDLTSSLQSSLVWLVFISEILSILFLENNNNIVRSLSY